jgi:hypothetical protein
MMSPFTMTRVSHEPPILARVEIRGFVKKIAVS